MLELGATKFQSMAFDSCAEWLWSGWPARYPELKIAMSEGGIAWVGGLKDRVHNIMTRSGYGSSWPAKDVTPAECLLRNFWFCMIDDPSTVSTIPAMGWENVMCESDYPHGDGTWPDTQPVIHELVKDMSIEHQRMLTHENACKLYRLPLPEKRLP